MSTYIPNHVSTLSNDALPILKSEVRYKIEGSRGGEGGCCKHNVTQDGHGWPTTLLWMKNYMKGEKDESPIGCCPNHLCLFQHLHYSVSHYNLHLSLLISEDSGT